MLHRSFSDALYELAIAQRHCITVSGTHGSIFDTTNLAAHLLLATGREPSLLVGGISLDFDGSFREGTGAHFVVEGDEYEHAFLDKTPKFLHYKPDTLIPTSVEFDHADIYRDLDHVKEAFRDLVASLSPDARIVAALGHDGVRTWSPARRARSSGTVPNANRAKRFRPGSSGGRRSWRPSRTDCASR